MKVVRYYGCVKCQKQHWQDIEPELFNKHIFYQSKHGIEERLFSEDTNANVYIQSIRKIQENNQ